MLKDFLADIKTVRSPDTHRTYGYLLNPFERWLKEEHKSLEICTYSDVYAYLESHKAWARQTKGQLIIVVKQYFRWYRGRIPMGVTTEEIRQAFTERQRTDQLIEMRFPTYMKRGETSKKKALTLPELKSLLDIMYKKNDYIIVYLLAYFGMRKSELIRIKAKDINFNKGEIKIMGAKTYRIRKSYFNPGVGKLLREFLNITYTADTYNKLLYKYSAKLKIKIFPHMFRHTFITEMIRSVENPHNNIIIKRLVGHTVEDITDQYIEVSENELKNAMLKSHYMADLPVKILGLMV